MKIMKQDVKFSDMYSVTYLEIDGGSVSQLWVCNGTIGENSLQLVGVRARYRSFPKLTIWQYKRLGCILQKTKDRTNCVVRFKFITKFLYSTRCPSCRLAESRARCTDVNDLNDTFSGN